jgi:hypothetical protein
MVMYGKAMRKKFTNWSLDNAEGVGVVAKFAVAVVFSELEELLLVEEDVLASASDCALVRKR